jgi:hypothetical protein
LPFRLAKIAVVVNLAAAFIDEPLAGVIGGARDCTLPFAAGDDADFEAI